MHGIIQCTFSSQTQPLIHRACTYGELDTLTDLIEVKGVDPNMVDEVGSDC